MSALNDLKQWRDKFKAEAGKEPTMILATPEMLDALNEDRRLTNPYGDKPKDLKFGDVVLGLTILPMDEKHVDQASTVMLIKQPRLGTREIGEQN